MLGTSTRRRRGSMAISNDFELDDEFLQKYRQAKFRDREDDSLGSGRSSTTDQEGNSNNPVNCNGTCCSARALLIFLTGCLSIAVVLLCKNASFVKFDTMMWMNKEARPHCNTSSSPGKLFPMAAEKEGGLVNSHELHKPKNVQLANLSHAESTPSSAQKDDVEQARMTIFDSTDLQGVHEDAAAVPLKGYDELSVTNQNHRRVEKLDVEPSSQRQHNISAQEKMKLALIGERNSGTTWTHQHLVDCFDHALDVQPSLVRFKHWFQEDVLPQERIKPTVVVAQFRDPYYWVEAMRSRAYHSPYHRKISNWTEYVTKPWTMPRLAQDVHYRDMVLQMDTENKYNESDIECQDHFRYDQINSCTMFPYDYHGSSEDNDLDSDVFSRIQDTVRYEMHQEGPHRGEPYNNILELRRDKILNFLSLAKWKFIHELITVKYEDLLADGTSSLIRHVERATGKQAKASCHPKDPQTSRAKRPLDPDFVAYMTRHVDWETEALVGYFPHANLGGENHFNIKKKDKVDINNFGRSYQTLNEQKKAGVAHVKPKLRRTT